MCLSFPPLDRIIVCSLIRWHHSMEVGGKRMPNVIIQYYEGILQELRSEVDSINSTFIHQG
jgi:hypothetical protein